MQLLHKSIEELKREVKSLRNEVSQGKGAIRVLIFLGSLVAAIIGFFQFK